MHSGSDSFSRVAREWRRRLEQEPGRRESRRSRPAPGWAFPSPAEPWRYRQAMAYKRRLLRQYAHAQLHEVLPGQERETGYGVCYLLERHEEMPAGGAVPAAHADRLAADLQLVRGIGPATERALRQAGVASLADLAGHPRFGEGARELQAALAGGDARTVASFIRRKHPPSHPALLHACALCGLEGLLFLDLETLGLFGAPIILFGLARVEAGRVRVEQYLVRDVAEEAAALAAVAAAVEAATALVTYNGRAFDVPYLESRGA
ncbi:MAG: ribonuclease H-like domain-containing protein, partial [Syntrophomonadaceae bacterium]|nr:ribonuclease H-like domain-containing protein [Syntrophomonadaceae bacterium]